MMKTAIIKKLNFPFRKSDNLKDYYFKFETYNDSTYRYQWISGCHSEAQARYELRARYAYLASDKMSPLAVLRGIIKVIEKESCLNGK